MSPEVATTIGAESCPADAVHTHVAAPVATAALYAWNLGEQFPLPKSVETSYPFTAGRILRSAEAR
jgi:hypothetical protein